MHFLSNALLILGILVVIVSIVFLFMSFAASNAETFIKAAGFFGILNGLNTIAISEILRYVLEKRAAAD